MRVVSKVIEYELTPEEFASGLEKVIAQELADMLGKWEVVKQTRKGRMQFDANYNRYYAKVTYERTV